MGKNIQQATFSRSKLGLVIATFIACASATPFAYANGQYPIVDTNQTQCSGTRQVLETCPTSGEAGFGQDAQYIGHVPSYTQNSDGTVTDNVTGLIWAASIDTNGDGKVTAADKMTYQQALNYAATLTLAGHSDWRIPSIKELFSLILLDGEDPSGINGAGEYSIRPFIDHQNLDFQSGDMDAGERLIDSQYVSSNKYVSKTQMGDRTDDTVFGVNFIDGRIKGYGMSSPRGGEKTFYVLAVRGNNDYGINQFNDQGNQTIKDAATGLIWQQSDSTQGMDWPSALSYCENLELGGRSDWRLPNVKELQSIVDYSRSPDTSNSAAIDPLFTISTITNEGGKLDYPNYWSSSTHQNLRNAANASYVAFGRSMGYVRGSWGDVHGAGAQRSDPKVDNGKSYPEGHGPQGDAIRFDNYTKCVTGGDVQFVQQPAVQQRATKVYTLSEVEDEMSGPGGNGGSDKRSGKRNPFVDLDSNGDGKLSQQEVKGPLAQHFDKLDVNGDGYLTQDEIPARKK
ncbi:Lcl domain-containing protein [Vibrio hippocampi]|uniref:DUF1566 domain-containing protein n=1 Tax=Vibrio hippocampi TaxID=654686 RepID=A0ABN8DK70_9VIBR|nr:DUF1566 domain-containing protein [Vibrio hippocampi]CAH0529729.1 hypothetical protein VHP8226_03485 [Vibrio hippocampi]